MGDEVKAHEPGEVPLVIPHRFHVTGWVAGNAFGVLTVSSDAVTFEPGRLTRILLRLSGRLVHRDRRVVVILSPLHLGGATVALRADSGRDGLLNSAVLGPVTHANLTVLPWQTSRIVSALRSAGFDVDRRRRWLFRFWRPID
jgi:hypothetical protein